MQAVISEAARTMPHTLRAVPLEDEEAASLSMLCGLDVDLARQIDQTSKCIRSLYTQIHPALKQALGPRLDHDAVLTVIAIWPNHAQLRGADKARIDAKLKKAGARKHAA